MNEICNKNRCCGCEACKNICPKGAITFIENEYGYRVPKIDEKKCINCGMCKKICPQVNTCIYNSILKCYASIRKDQAKRMDSASGGIASVMYEHFLEKHKKRSVYGVAFNEEMRAIFKKAKRTDEINEFKGSKYVQAETNNLFTDIYDSLRNDEYVLVVGTPCQIAAVYRFLELKKVSIEKLLTVDLICHGVAPYKYLKEDIEYLKDKFKWKKINKLTFRSNRKYRNFHFCVDALSKGNFKKSYNKFFNEDPYFLGYLKGITLRENCYDCKYANTNRVSDVTIGDFIGLGKHQEFEKFDGNPVNNSIILCNTQKGKKYVEQLKNELFLIERPIAEALIDCVSLKEPFQRHELRDEFLKGYKNDGFIKTMQRLTSDDLNSISKKEKILRPIKIFIAKHLDRKLEKHEK